MVRIIFTNGAELAVNPANGTDFELDVMQGIVGGLIEIVRLKDGYIMVCNEEGLLEGLEVNEKASKLAGYKIVGNVLVCPSSMVK